MWCRCCVSTGGDVWYSPRVWGHHLRRWGSCCGPVWSQRGRHRRQGWCHAQDGYYLRDSWWVYILYWSKVWYCLWYLPKRSWVIMWHSPRCEFSCLFIGGLLYFHVYSKTLLSLWESGSSLFLLFCLGSGLICVTQCARGLEEAGAALLLGDYELLLRSYWITPITVKLMG